MGCCGSSNNQANADVLPEFKADNKADFAVVTEPGKVDRLARF
jgi:hypothetical protein